MNKIQSLIASRRFQLLVVGMIMAFSEDIFNVKLDQETTNWALSLIIAWILGDSYRKTE